MGFLINRIRNYWKDFFYRNLTLNLDNWDFYTHIFRFAIKSSKVLGNPIIGKLAARLDSINGSDDFSQGHIVPIKREISYEGRRQVVAPIEKFRDAIEESSYRSIMNKCICRDSMSCSNYPRDFACIMLGEASRSLVMRGVARYATVDEAKTHLERGAKMGLVGVAAWVEYEADFMGISEEDNQKLMEICMCCPCCCIGISNLKYTMKNEFVRERFRSVGWRANSVDNCVACGVCVNACPMEAISIEGDDITIADNCVGCGICASQCPQGAIVMQETSPMKSSILDHFQGFRPQIDG